MRRTFTATIDLTFSLDGDAIHEQEIDDREPADLLRAEIASLGYTFPEVCDVHDETVVIRRCVPNNQEAP